MTAPAPKPRDKRLGKQDRNHLFTFAMRKVDETADTAALDAAYEAAAAAIHALVLKEWPPADMAILARYKVADDDCCIMVSPGGFGAVEQFCFRKGDARIPLRPKRFCNRMPVLLDDATTVLWRALCTEVIADKKRREERLKAFSILIHGARSFNEVVAAWPAAEALRERLCGSTPMLPATLSADVLDRIKADPAFAQPETVPA